jgi:quercetin dioxygenase-like cupin family protein
VVLDRIADGLGVSLTRLLADPTPERVVVRRAGEQDTAAYPSGWHRTILSPVVPGVNFELVRVTLPAGCDAGEFPAYAAGSHEYIAVESGEVRVTVGDQTIDLAAGDSLYFAADVTHRYANRTGEPATYYVAALVMRSRA